MKNCGSNVLALFFFLFSIEPVLAQGSSSLENVSRYEHRSCRSALSILKQASQQHVDKPELTHDSTREMLHHFHRTLDSQRIFILADDVERFLSVDDERLEVLHRNFLSERITYLSQYHGKFLVGLGVAQRKFSELEAMPQEELVRLLENEIEAFTKERNQELMTTQPDSNEEIERRIQIVLAYNYNKFQKMDDDVDERQAIILALRAVRDLVYKHSFRFVESVPEIMINAYFKTFGPHTYWRTQESAISDFQTYGRDDTVGAGVLIMPVGDYIKIKKVNPGGGAEAVGLKEGDRINAIVAPERLGGDWHSIESTLDAMTQEDFISTYWNGEVGTEIQLQVTRPGAFENKIFRVVRRRIESNSAFVHLNVSHVDGEKVGFISFYKFSAGASAEVKNKLKEAKEQGVNSIILDLRNNGGGLISEATEIVSLFMESPVVYGTVDGNGEVQTVGTEILIGPEWDGPLGVLVNGNSASASELTAGALRDLGRAIVIGPTSTFGKGSGQAPTFFPTESHERSQTRLVRSLQDAQDNEVYFDYGSWMNDLQNSDDPNFSTIGGLLGVTTFRYVTPSGRSPQKEGITPDVFVTDFREYQSEADLENALDSINVDPLIDNLDELTERNRTIIPELRTLSENRTGDWTVESLIKALKDDQDPLTDEFVRIMRDYRRSIGEDR